MSTGFELNTLSKLLKAAISQFAKQGFTGASVRKIADEAGVPHGAIKYHYSGKEELWRAAISHLYAPAIKRCFEIDVFEEDQIQEQLATVLQISNAVKHTAAHALGEQ